jgi:hypothetical protein
MELDDLKQDWNKPSEHYKAPAFDLNDLLAKQTAGPLATLKAKYRLQAILLPLAAGVLGFSMMQHAILRQNALIWFIVPVLLLLALMYYRDYSVIVKIEETNAEALKISMQERIALLQRNGKQQLYLTRVILLVLIGILEATMYLQEVPDFLVWQGIALPLRLTAYIMVVFVQPYISTYFFNLSFGQYLNRLQELLNQTK